MQLSLQSNLVHSHYPRRSSAPFSHHPQTRLSPQLWATTDLSVGTDMPILDIPYKWSHNCAVIWNWNLSLSITFQGSCCNVSELHSFLWLDHIFFINLLADGHLDYFYLWIFKYLQLAPDEGKWSLVAVNTKFTWLEKEWLSEIVLFKRW